VVVGLWWIVGVRISLFRCMDFGCLGLAGAGWLCSRTPLISRTLCNALKQLGVNLYHYIIII